MANGIDIDNVSSCYCFFKLKFPPQVLIGPMVTTKVPTQVPLLMIMFF